MNALVAYIAAEIAYSKTILVGMRPTDDQKSARSAAIAAKTAELDAREMPSKAAYKAIVTRAGLWRVLATPADISDVIAMRSGVSLTDASNQPRWPSFAASIIETFAEAIVTREGKTFDEAAASDRKEVVVTLDTEKMMAIAGTLDDGNDAAVLGTLIACANETRLGLMVWDEAQAQVRNEAKNQRELAKAA